MAENPIDVREDFARWEVDYLRPVGITTVRQSVRVQGSQRSDTLKSADSLAQQDENQILFANFAYFLTTVSGVILLALITGVTSRTLWPVLGILVGYGAGLFLINQARITVRGSIARVLMYTAGFILLFEVVEFIDAVVAHGNK